MSFDRMSRQEVYMRPMKRADWLFAACGGALIVLFMTALAGLHAAEKATVVPAPAFDNPHASGELQTAVLAGGCFWGTQGVFEHVKGVRKVFAGYSGGDRS